MVNATRQKGTWSFIAALTLSIALSLLPYSSILSGGLPGDKGDAMWTIGIMEAWLDWARGSLNFGNTWFFYPEPNSMGLSDALLPQSFVYGLARIIGFANVDAWLITIFVFVAMMSISLTWIAFTTLKSGVTRIGFVAIASSNYAFHAEMSHVQTTGYSLVFLLVAILLSVFSKKQISGKKILPAFIVLSLIPLASWYAFVFFLMISSVYFIWIVFLTKANFLKLWNKMISVEQKPYIVLGASSVILGLFVWLQIYLPIITSGQSGREWGEYLNYAPRMFDILNVSRGNLAWGDFFSSFGLFLGNSGERALGVPFLLFTAFGISSVYLLSKASRSNTYEFRHSGLLAVAVTVVSIFAIFVVDENSLAVFRVFWELIPGASTIRSPMRVVVFLIPIIIWIIAKILDSKTISSGKNKFLAFGLFLILTLDQQTTHQSNWSRADYPSMELNQLSDQIQEADCDATLMWEDDLRESPWWRYEIFSATVASILKVPTINGYSGSPPSGLKDQSLSPHPYSTNYLTMKQEWLGNRGFEGKLCLISYSSQTVSEIISDSQN